MEEKIYGYYTRGDEEGKLDVTVVLPEAMADFFCVDSQWDMVLEPGENVKWAAIEMIEEQAAGDTEGALYDSLCEYLEDDENWDGDVEEGVVLEGMDAVQQYLNGCGPRM